VDTPAAKCALDTLAGEDKLGDHSRPYERGVTQVDDDVALRFDRLAQPPRLQSPGGSRTALSVESAAVSAANREISIRKRS
jgi:hypothetical protein